jgi:hypothetical protein
VVFVLACVQVIAVVNLSQNLRGAVSYYSFADRKHLPLSNWLLRRYWVIPHLYAQQLQMHETKGLRCNDRIVSISQPWVCPNVRGKHNKSTEFGGKFRVSLYADGLVRIDRHTWDAIHEGIQESPANEQQEDAPA